MQNSEYLVTLLVVVPKWVYCIWFAFINSSSDFLISMKEVNSAFLLNIDVEDSKKNFFLTDIIYMVQEPH